jgi:sulfur-oxidizing protein SoxA
MPQRNEMRLSNEISPRNEMPQRSLMLLRNLMPQRNLMLLRNLMLWMWRQVLLLCLVNCLPSFATRLSLATLLSFSVLAQADPVGAERQSSYVLMSSDTKAMQDDPLLNPATFTVLDGEVLWKELAGKKNQSCASCHGDATVSMKGVAASYPKVGAAGQLFNLEGRINQCRIEQQDATPFAFESKPLLALEAFVANQSKGMPITVERSPANEAALASGQRLFNQRMGQLNLSCAQCHAERSGQKLAGNPIPQAHPTAYPIYRLEWQAVGSLERRLRNCMVGVRAEPYAFGSTELLELELFLAWRAREMPLESPGVRP